MVENWCDVNGELVRDRDARISVLDRGFLFGDSVYEVMRTRHGVPFTWREHLSRLRASASGIGLDLGVDDREIMARIERTAARARGPDEECYIRIVVTRGVGSEPNIDLSYAKGPPTFVILVRALPDMRGKPARLSIVDRLRNDRSALDPAIKSGNYLNNVLGLAEARVAGATDCLFLNAAGEVTEASTSNVWIVQGGVVRTPPLGSGLLAGITRGLLQDCMTRSGIAWEEAVLRRTDVEAASEIFLSSTMRDVAPVTQLDGRPIRGAQPGPVTTRVMRGFEAYCEHRVGEVDGPQLATLLEGH
jgi:branched-chain amino acid aminotransferase